MPKLNKELESIRDKLVYQLFDQRVPPEKIAKILLISTSAVYTIIREREK